MKHSADPYRYEGQDSYSPTPSEKARIAAEAKTHAEADARIAARERAARISAGVNWLANWNNRRDAVVRETKRDHVADWVRTHTAAIESRSNKWGAWIYPPVPWGEIPGTPDWKWTTEGAAELARVQAEADAMSAESIAAQWESANAEMRAEIDTEISARAARDEAAKAMMSPDEIRAEITRQGYKETSPGVWENHKKRGAFVWDGKPMTRREFAWKID